MTALLAFWVGAAFFTYFLYEAHRDIQAERLQAKQASGIRWISMRF